MKIGILDYGAGNLHSLAKAIEATGATSFVTTELQAAIESDAIVLPGVGAFGSALQTLNADIPALKSALENGFPCVGICLGMQLLFDRSEEGTGRGVGIFQGDVRRLRSERIPQIGWNDVTPLDPADSVFSDFQLGYYANSYVCIPQDESSVVAETVYEAETFPAAVRRFNTFGVQFHPEKSSRAGVALLGRILSDITR